MSGTVVLAVGGLLICCGLGIVRLYHLHRSQQQLAVIEGRSARPIPEWMFPIAAGAILVGLLMAGIGYVLREPRPSVHVAVGSESTSAAARGLVPILGYTESPNGTLVIHYRIPAAKDLADSCPVSVTTSGLAGSFVTVELREYNDVPGGTNCDRERYFTEILDEATTPIFAVHDTGTAPSRLGLQTGSPVVDVAGTLRAPAASRNTVPAL